MSLSSDRIDILTAASRLRPVLLEARFDWWRRGGIAGVAESNVRKSRSLPMPAFDHTDQEILRAERLYREALEDARKSLDRARAIELTWLIEIHIATKEEREKATDDVQCLACLFPIVGSPRSGFCKPCSQAWYDDGKPDRMQWIKKRRLFLEMDEALEA